MQILKNVYEFDYLMNNVPVKMDWENFLSHKIRYSAIRDTILRYNLERLLDIGCGKGILEYLLPENIFCLGCDIVEEYIENAKLLNEHKKNRQFELCDVEKNLPSHEKFDTIVMTEVLEHMYDDGEVLRKMRKLLTDDGILITTVPNFNRLTNKLLEFSRILNSGKPQFQDETHLREYTVNEMKTLLHKCGFETMDIIGIYLQLPKENSLPKKFRLILSPFVDNIAINLPFFACSILLTAKKYPRV